MWVSIIDDALQRFMIYGKLEILAQMLKSKLLQCEHNCRPSLSCVEWCLYTSFILLVAQYIGCYLPFSSKCGKTAPTAALDASVATKNCLLKSRHANTGAVVSASFSAPNDFCIRDITSNATFSKVFLNRGLAIFAKSLLNLWQWDAIPRKDLQCFWLRGGCASRILCIFFHRYGNLILMQFPNSSTSGSINEHFFNGIRSPFLNNNVNTFSDCLT